MNEPSGAGYAACAWRVPVLPTVVSKQFSGVRLSASKITTCPLATNDRTACVCSLLNRIMCGRTGFLPVAARQRSAVAAPRSRRAIGLALAACFPIRREPS